MRALRLAGALAAAVWVSPLLGAAAGSSPGPLQGTAASADIRDIHGPIWLPDWWRPWMLALLLVPAAGAALVAGRAIVRRRRRPRSPGERALARLEEAAPLAAAGQSRSYAELASGAVRTYLEESFGLPATHRTTDEFFSELLAQPLPPLRPHTAALEHFLAACDLAKFSLYGMRSEDMSSLNQIARELVLATVQPNPPAIPKSPPARTA